MLACQPARGGCVFGVKVAPRASSNAIQGVDQSVLKVRLTAPPVEGAANQALVKLLAKALGVAKGRVQIVSGYKSRDKRVLVQGLEPAEVLSRLGL
jgi:hypothetical protein